jgi:DNA-binding NtrC family response regulator
MQNHTSVGAQRRGEREDRRLAGPLGKEINRVERELAVAVESVSQASRVVEGLKDTLASRQRRVRSSSRRLTPYREARETWQREYIVEILEMHDGDVSKAAKAADIPVTSLYRLMLRHRLSRPR